jgi:hypothetical protein
MMLRITTPRLTATPFLFPLHGRVTWYDWFRSVNLTQTAAIIYIRPCQTKIIGSGGMYNVVFIELSSTSGFC